MEATCLGTMENGTGVPAIPSLASKLRQIFPRHVASTLLTIVIDHEGIMLNKIRDDCPSDSHIAMISVKWGKFAMTKTEPI